MALRPAATAGVSDSECLSPHSERRGETGCDAVTIEHFVNGLVEANLERQSAALLAGRHQQPELPAHRETGIGWQQITGKDDLWSAARRRLDLFP